MSAQGSYLRCPQCNLTMRASVWQIFGDQPGDCPRCAGMRSVAVPLEWEPVQRRGPRAAVVEPGKHPRPQLDSQA